MPELDLKAIQKDFKRVNELLKKEEYEEARAFLETVILDLKRVSDCLKSWARFKKRKLRLGQSVGARL